MRVKRFFKGLTYSLLFMLVTIGSAYGVINISMSNFVKQQNSSTADTPVEVQVPEQIQTMVNNIMSEDLLSLYADIDITVNGEKYDIGLDAVADLSAGFKNIEAMVNLNAAIESAGVAFDAQVVYQNQNIFVSALNGKFVMPTTSLMSTVTNLLDTFGIEMPDLGFLSGLDLNGILGMLSDLEETQTETQNILLVNNLPVVGSIEIACDKNYNLTGITLPAMEIEGIGIEANINVGYPTENQIPVLESSEYLSVESLINIASAVAKVPADGKVALDFDVTVDGKNIGGYAGLDFKNMAVAIEVAVDKFDVKLVIKDKVVYAQLNNLFVKYDLANINELLSLLRDEFGIEIPAELINTLLGLLDGNVDALTSNMDFDLSIINDIDLSILESLQKVETGYIISIKDVGDIGLEIAEDTLSKIVFENGKLNASLEVAQFKDIVLGTSEENYIDIAKFIPTIKQAANILKSQTLVGSVNVQINDINVTVNYQLAFSDAGIQAVLNATFMEQNIQIVINGKDVFVNLLGSKIKVNIDEFESIIDKIMNTFAPEKAASDTESTSILDEIFNMIDASINPLLITHFEAANDSLKLTILDKYEITIGQGENNIDFGFNMDGIVVNGNISGQNQAIILPVIDASKYMSVVDIIDIVCAAAKVPVDGKVALDFDVTVDGKNIGGYAGLDFKNMAVAIEVAVDKFDVKLVIKDKVVYAQLNNLFVKYDLANINELLSLLRDEFGIEIPAELINTLLGLLDGNVDALTSNMDFDLSIINDIDLSILESLQKVETGYIISIKDVGDIGLEIAEDTLSKIVFENGKLNASLEVAQFKDIVLGTSEENYIDIAKFIPTIKQAANILKSQTLVGSVNVQINDINVTVNYQLAFSDAGIQAVLNATFMEQNIQIVINGKDVFVNLLGSKIKVNIDEFESIIDKIMNTFAPEKAASDTESTSILDEIFNMIDASINPLLITHFEAANDSLKLTILDKYEITIGQGGNNIDFGFNMDGIVVTGNVSGQDEAISLPAIDENDYTPAAQIIDAAINVYEYIQKKEFYLTITNAQIDDIIANAAVNYADGKLELSLTAQYQNVTANIMLYEDRIYVTAENIKAVFGIDEIDSVFAFVKDNFSIDLKQMLNDLMGQTTETENQTETQIDIENILSKLSIELGTDKIVVKYANDIAITINLEDLMVKDIVASGTVEEIGFNADIIIEDSPLEFKPQGEYVEVSVLMEYVQAALDQFKSKQLQMDADVTINKDHIGATLQLDLTDGLLLSAKLSSKDIENMDISANVEDGMLYFDYNGLCLKMNNTGFKELLTIVLGVFGIDQSLFPFLDDIDLDLDYSQISTELGSIGIDQIIDMLGYVKGISADANSLTIVLNNDAIYGTTGSPDMTIVLIKNANGLESLSVSNIYTGSDKAKTINASVTFDEFSAFNYVDQSKNYIDISGANELVKAIVNMSTGTDYHVKGSLDIVGTLGADLLDISWNVPIDIKINVVGKGQIELEGVIGEIPAMIGVNNDVPYKEGDTESGSDRMLYIYYKDGYVYLYRSEYVDIMFGISKRHYEKCTKISIDTLLADPLYYVQYGIGFTDTIMNAIKESIMRERTEPIDYSNIIHSFTVTDGTKYSAQIDMNEITADPVMGNMDIYFELDKDSADKNYIASGGMKLNMPLADVFHLTLSSSDLALVDVGQEVNMSKLYEYVNNYKYSAESEWQANEGSWEMVRETLYNINFVTGNDLSIAPQAYHYKDQLSLPNIELHTTVDSNFNPVTTYKFLSWHTDASLSDESLFTDTTMGRGDITLYAKWEIVGNDQTAIITFDSAGGTQYSYITAKAGSKVDLSAYVPTKATEWRYIKYLPLEVKYLYEYTSYQFEYWYTDDPNTPFDGIAKGGQKTTLHAKYAVSTGESKFTYGNRPDK